MAGLARKIQAHEAAQNSTKCVPPGKITKDASSQVDGGVINHVTNGVGHHPE